MPEALFINVASKVKGLALCIGPFHCSLEMAEEVLNPVGRDFALHVFKRMVNKIMNVLLRQPLVRFKCIRVNGRTWFHDLLDVALQSLFVPAYNHLRDDLTPLNITRTVYDRPKRWKPFCQWQFTVFKDSSDLYAKLLTAAIRLQEVFSV